MSLHLAYFSESCAQLIGSSFYQLPDGGEVEVTDVERTLEDSGIFQWSDRVEVGPVTKYLRKGRIGTLENKMECEELYSYVSLPHQPGLSLNNTVPPILIHNVLV